MFHNHPINKWSTDYPKLANSPWVSRPAPASFGGTRRANTTSPSPPREPLTPTVRLSCSRSGRKTQTLRPSGCILPASSALLMLGSSRRLLSSSDSRQAPFIPRTCREGETSAPWCPRALRPQTLSARLGPIAGRRRLCCVGRPSPGGTCGMSPPPGSPTLQGHLLIALQSKTGRANIHIPSESHRGP